MKTYTIMLKRSGEDPVEITASINRFEFQNGTVFNAPGDTPGTLRSLVNMMDREGLEELEIKEA